MVFDVRATNFGLDAGVREYIQRRMAMSLDRYEHRIDRLEVVLTNLHGRNHVRELQCSARVHLPHTPDVVIEQTDSDLIAAVDVTASRLKRTVRRAINRQREQKRREARHAAAA